MSAQSRSRPSIVRAVLLVFAITLAISLVVGGAVAFFIYKRSLAGGRTKSPINSPAGTVALAQSAAESDPAKATSANDCDDFLDRYSEIDNGAKDGREAPIVPIRTIGARYPPTPEYIKLKDCWRSQRIGKTKPDIQYNGLGFGLDSLRLGMTATEAARALPIQHDMTTGQPNLAWLYDKCAPALPDKDTNIRANCYLHLRTPPGWDEATHSPGPDLLILSFDRDGEDGKLIAWLLSTSALFESFKTTDSVIRFERQSSGFAALGPPDTTDRSHADWTFYDNDPSNPLETVSLSVVGKEGAAYLVSIGVTDDEHYYTDEHKAFRRGLFRAKPQSGAKGQADTAQDDDKVVTKETEITGTVFDVQQAGNACASARTCWWQVIVELPGNEEWSLQTPDKPTLSKGQVVRAKVELSASGKKFMTAAEQKAHLPRLLSYKVVSGDSTYIPQ
jgi:hypothetical protein